MSTLGISNAGGTVAHLMCQCGHSEMLHSNKPGDDHCYVSGCMCKDYKRDPDKKPSSSYSNSQRDTYPSWQGHGYYSAGTPYVKCEHKPTLVIDGGKDGWKVYAGAKWDVQDKAGEHDVVLNCTGTTIFYNHSVPFDWYEDVPRSGQGKATECLIDWDDMQAPALHPIFWKKLLEHLRKTKGKMLVFCIGGHGRTGTALVSLLIAAGWARKKALKYLRKNYCHKIVETDAQLKYLAYVEKTLRALDGKKVEDEGEEPSGSKSSSAPLLDTSVASGGGNV